MNALWSDVAILAFTFCSRVLFVLNMAEKQSWVWIWMLQPYCTVKYILCYTEYSREFKSYKFETTWISDARIFFFFVNFPFKLEMHRLTDHW